MAMTAKKPPRTIVYTRTPTGPIMLPALDQESREEEAAVEYRRGGYLPIAIDDRFSKDRYVVVRKLGWGHFSTVWLVRDARTNLHSALKVVKSAPRYTETALDEIKLLKQIASTSPGHTGCNHIVKLLDSFEHLSRGDIHVCMVMEPLGETLVTLIERNKHTSLSRDLIKSIVKQMLLGLQFLHEHCDLVHTDLKPENILIAIPDVEEHVRNELLNAVAPSSRHVGIPIEPRVGSSNTVRRLDKTRERVRIFDSQPLPSPPQTRSSSHRSSVDHIGLVMSALKIANDNSPNSTLTSGQNSVDNSLGGFSIGTAPTSLGSNPPKIQSRSQSSFTETLCTDKLISRISAAKHTQGPSLLSQTAPASESLHGTSFVSSLGGQPFAAVLDVVGLKDEASEQSYPIEKDGIFLSPPHLPQLPELHEGATIHIKIADLGNASPSKKHFTEDIQTRQYRSPEAILGRCDWDAKADMWSIGCITFELLTGDPLFDPQSRHDQFTKDDDHMAMIIELLGDEHPFDHEFKMGGKYSRDIFDSKGELRRIHDLKKWPLRRVLVEKYVFSPDDAATLCLFMLPMLAINPRDRASAAEMLEHQWFNEV